MRAIGSLKTCTGCKETKTLDLFYKNRCASDGYSNQCKDCMKKWSKKWHNENKERHAEHSRKWAQENPEWVKKYTKEHRHSFYVKSKEKVLAKAKEWKKDNKERYDAWCKPYQAAYIKNHYANNLDKYQAYRQNRRVRVMNAEGSFTAKEWRDLCEKYNNRCLCCGRDDVSMTADHIVPLSKGGSNYISNIQPLCLSCNMKKHTKTIDYRNSVYAVA